MKDASLQKEIKSWLISGLKTKTITFEDDLVDLTVSHFKQYAIDYEEILNYIIEIVNNLETKYENFLKSL